MAVKRDQADIWFSKAVRLRDQKCMHCHKTDRLECSHIYGRANKRVRWAMSNCIALCHACHRYMTSNPVAHFDFLNDLLGEEHMDKLRMDRNEIYKTNKLLRKDIGDHYRDEVRRKELDPDYEIQSWN